MLSCICGIINLGGILYKNAAKQPFMTKCHIFWSLVVLDLKTKTPSKSYYFCFSCSQIQSQPNFLNESQSAMLLVPSEMSEPPCTHSCALLQQRTVAMSPPLASSALCDCYWKCSVVTGASSRRIYMTQVPALESTRVHKYTNAHIRRHASGPAHRAWI